VVGVDPERRRGLRLQLLFHRQHGLARRQPGAVADPENMRVDREGLRAKGTVHHHIGGLAPNPRQPDQRLAIRRHLAAKFRDQHFRQRDHILRLVIIKPDRLDMLLQPLKPQIDHLLRRLHLGEQFPGRLVDANIGRLRRQRHRDDELVGIAIVEFGLRRRIVGGEAGVEFEDIGFFHGASCGQAAGSLQDRKAFVGTSRAAPKGGGVAGILQRQTIRKLPYLFCAVTVIRNIRRIEFLIALQRQAKKTGPIAPF